jgi:hypothetical protein
MESGMSEIEQTELAAAIYKVKYSDNEVECIESAKYILNRHMNISSLRSTLNVMQLETLNSKDSVEQQEAVNRADIKLSMLMAQLFVNTFRLGMLDQQNEFKELMDELKPKN